MKKLFFFFILIFQVSYFNCAAQAPNWLWAKSAGGSGDDEATSIAVDASGNTYLTGYFSSPTIIFGNTTLTNTDVKNLFLAKYDLNGNVLWAKSADGGSFQTRSVAVDDSDNVYMTGAFCNSTIIFGSTTLSNMSLYSCNIFLVKYDGNGNVVWAKSAGGTLDDGAVSVAIDTLGNPYITGIFTSPSITFGSTTLTNAGYNDLFIVKYDFNGNVLWAKSAVAGGTGGIDMVNSIIIDAIGNAYLAGYFSSPSLTFGSTTLTSSGDYDLFLAKYDVNGNALWVKSADGTSGTRTVEANSVAVDAFGNAYIAGYFTSYTLTFGSTTLDNAGSADIFLTKYDSIGNVIWAKSAGSNTDDIAYSIAVDNSGCIYMTGYFSGDSIVCGSYVLNNEGTWGTATVLILKYDSSGNVLWAKSAGGTVSDIGTSIGVDVVGNSYIAGYFQSPSIAFGSTTLMNNSIDTADIFLAKLSSTLGINEFSKSLTITVYPNPAINKITIDNSQQATIEITNIEGQFIETLATTGNKTNIDVSALARGMYFVKVKTEKGVAVKKFVKE